MHFFAHIYIMFVCRQHFCKIFSMVNITSFSNTNSTIRLFQPIFMNAIVLFMYTECLNIYVICQSGSRILRRNNGQHSHTWSAAQKCQVEKYHFYFEATASENKKPQTTVCEQDTHHKQAIETQPYAKETEPIHGNKYRRQYTRVCRRNFSSKKTTGGFESLLRRIEQSTIQSSEYYGCVLHAKHTTNSE